MSVVQTLPSFRRNEAPALSSPPNPNEPSSRPSTNHLKPTGTSASRRRRSLGYAVDHRAAHERLADGSALVPAALGEQVADRHTEVVIRVEKPPAAGHDAVPIEIRVVAKRDVVLVAEIDQAGHCVGRRAIHSDLPVAVERHERERRVDDLVDDVEPQPVALRDARPVLDARSAHRVDADSKARVRNRPHVENGVEPFDVGRDEVVDVGRIRAKRPRRTACAGRLSGRPPTT